MLAAPSLPDALTTAGKVPAFDDGADLLLWGIVAAVTLALGVVCGIAISNWRAKRAIRQARAHWASVAPRNRAGVDNVRPNPLRRR